MLGKVGGDYVFDFGLDIIFRYVCWFCPQECEKQTLRQSIYVYIFHNLFI